MGATLDNPETLYVTDGDTKAYRREAMCSDEHMQMMAELSRSAVISAPPSLLQNPDIYSLDRNPSQTN